MKVKELFKSCLRNIDILGDQFTITLERKDHHTTSVGGIFSIFVIGFTIIATLKILYSYFNLRQPFVNERIDVIDYFPFVDLSKERYAPFFALQRPDTQFVLSDNVFKYITPLLQISRTIILEEGEIEFAEHSFNFIPCRYADRDIYSVYLEDPWVNETFKTYGVCIDLDEPEWFYINASVNDLNYTEAFLHVYPCVNRLKDKCLSNEEDMNGLVLLKGISNKKIDLLSFFNPVVRYPIIDDPITIDLGITLVSIERLRSVTLRGSKIDFVSNSELELFTETFSKDNYFEARNRTHIYCTPDSLIIGSCVPYISIEIQNTNQKRSITRTYQKLIYTLGVTGGVLIVMVIIGRTIFSCWNSLLYRSFLRVLFTQNKYHKLRHWFRHQNQARYDKMLDEIVERKRDGIGMIQDLCKVEILTSLAFKSHHRSLTPLLMIQLEHQRQEQEKIAKHLLAASKYKSEQPLSIKFKTDKEKEEEWQNDLDLEKCFKYIQNRLQLKRGSEMETLIDEYFISKLNPIFKADEKTATQDKEKRFREMEILKGVGVPEVKSLTRSNQETSLKSWKPKLQYMYVDQPDEDCNN